jgi:hypothetical protein
MWGWVVNSTPRPLYPRERDRRLGGPVWTGAEILAPTGIRSPGSPARSESLYRLRYPGPPGYFYHTLNRFCFCICIKNKREFILQDYIYLVVIWRLVPQKVPVTNIQKLITGQRKE